MASQRKLLLALFTLSLLRSACGKSFIKGGDRVKDGPAKAGSIRGRSSDVFIFADGQRHYDDPVCPSDCLKCSIRGECLHCTNSKYLDPVKSSCEDMCPDGYFPGGTGISNRTCTPCSDDCAVCLSREQCVQCASKYLTPTGSCESSCPAGHYNYDKNGAGTCKPCPATCQTCSNWNTCDVCAPGAYLSPNRSCSVVCDDGYYKNDPATPETGGVCAKCDDRCSKCISRDVCSECKKKMYLSQLDNMCGPSCADGFYKQGTAEIGNTCEECPDSCSRCSNSTQCSRCKDGYFLTPNATCAPFCPEGYYANSTLKRCQSCPKSCGTCTAGLVSPVVCLECSDYKYLSHRGECVSTCQEGYYAEGYSGPFGGQCILCNPACTACNSRTECTKCQMLHYLAPDSSCKKLECPRGLYARGGIDLKEPGVCLECAENCAECESLEACTVCKNNYYLHQGRCLESCPTRFFGVEVKKSSNPEGRTCRSCRFHDYECSSPNALVEKDPDNALTIISTSCQNDYFLYDGACHPKEFCPVGTYPRRGEELETEPGNFVGGNCSECPRNCLSCSSPTRCTTCKSSTFLTPEMSCEEMCPPGFYGIGTAETGRTCQPCTGNCLECQSQEFCTKCTNGTLLTHAFTCEAQCPAGYYPRNPADGSLDGRTCQKCVGDCLTCETRFSCTKCKNSAYLTHKKECKRECPASHYPDGSDAPEGRYCIECPGMCSECKSPHFCTQCKTPTFLTAHGTCEPSCQEGYWQEIGREVHSFWGLKVGGVCKSCPQNCDRCVGSGCIECNKFNYLSAAGLCVARCPDGYFGVGVEELGRVCVPCSETHGDCLNRTFVLQCGENLYLDPWNATCIQTCPAGYFALDGDVKQTGGPKIGGTCERCLGSCKSCSSATTCQVCTHNMYLNPITQRCTNDCPSDHYMVGNSTDGRTCKPCPPTAAKCVNETWTHECRGNNQYLVPEGGKCTTKCPQGYFARSGAQVDEDAPLVGGTCEKCVGSCSRCKSESECLECSGLYLDPTTSLCTLECPRDHFMVGTGEKGRACSPCPDNFAVCRNASYAVECRGDQQYLVPEGGRCTPSCLDGYYPRPGIALEVGGPLVGGTCERCVAPCETCISLNECKICKGGTYLNSVDLSCAFDCPVGTYMTGTGDVGRKCEACPAEMYSCINSTHASLCKGDNYYLTPKHSCELNCPDGYYRMGGSEVSEGGPMVGGTCQKCINNCATCYTESKCTSCRNGAFFDPRLEQCDFLCPEDHYMVGKEEEGRQCFPCPDEFHTCLNNTFGTHCHGNNRYLADNGTCRTSCPERYFRRPSTVFGVDGIMIGGECEKCVGDCRECVSDGECVVCENGKFLKNRTCLAACPTGFFQKEGMDGVNGTCEMCKMGATHCSVQDGVTVALACETGFELKNSECVNSCGSGKYKDPTTEKCADCPSTCAECISATKCSLCKDGESLDVIQLPNSSKCVSSCPDGFFADKGQCASCSRSCSKCDSTSACTQCKDHRYLSPISKTCEDDCPKGYSPVGTEATGRSCQVCSKNCVSCVSAGECRECGNRKYLVPEGWCEDGCPKGYYGKGDGDTGRTCEACPGDFFNCISPKLGTECKNRKYLTAEGTCESGCPTGTYPSGTGDLGRVCMPCGANCAVCTTGDTCDRCTNSYYLTPDLWCEDACPDGYYKSGTGKLNRTCALCPMDAMKCISPTVATECRDAKYLTAAGSCEYLCPEGTYPSGAGHSTVGRTCEVCDANCLTCKKADLCTKCKNGRYLTSDMWCEEGCPDGYYRNGTGKIGRNCVRCPLNAMKCIGPALVTECRDWLYLTPDGTCADGCPVGTYPSGVNQVGRTCEACDKDCISCTQENRCEQCRNGKYLTPSGWCEAACPHGTYKNGVGAVGNTCEPCPGDSSGCVHAKYATECKNSKFLTPDATCRDTCPVGYYPEGIGEVGKQCPRCQEHCFSCQSAALCTVCDNGRVLSPNMSCVDNCPNGYFRNASEKIGNNCTACTKHASKCLNLTHITECKNARYLNPDFTCQMDCPRGLFQLGDKDTGRVCTGCSSNCTLCVNATTCTECRNNNYLGPEFRCEPECPSDHYYEPPESLRQIDWKELRDQSCGGGELRTWSGGTDSRFGEGFVENVPGCQLMCMARAECAGFELREDSNKCSFWMGDASSPRPAKGIHCFRKVDLVPQKGKSAAGEVVIPAAGVASMSSRLETAPAKLCNDGLVSTRCSSIWNDAAGELNPWWQMDLGSKESLVKIRILSDPDGCEAMSEEATGLHCSLLGGVVGVSPTPCEKGKLCKGTVCGTLTETTDKWYEVSCDRAEGRYVYLQLKGYRVLNFYELVAYKVSETESCTETWQLTNVKQKGHTFTADNEEGGNAFAVAGPVSGIAFMPGQDDRPLWVGLTTDPTDERDFKNGKFIQLTASGSVAIEGAFEGLTYTREDYFRLELKGGEVIIYKNGASLHSFKLDSSGSLNGWYTMIWFPETKPDDAAAFVSRVQTTCFPLQEGVGGTCSKCPNHVSRCVNETIALECKDEMFLQLTHVCEPECPEGQFETDGVNGVGGFCSLCHENCKTCMNATTCLECKNQHYLTHDFKCSPECASGYYGVKSDEWEDGLGGRCKACHENCSACNSYEECTECRLYTFRTPSATCSDTCPDTYYKNGTEKVGGECVPCQDNCLQCVSANTCVVCNNSYFLAQSGECIEHCPDGEYEVGNEELGRECMRCPSGFNRCISANYASECNNHLYLTAGAKCETTCPDGFYRSPIHGKAIGRECPRCHEDCNKCENADACSECKNSKFLNPDLWCETDCPTGYYKVGNGEIGNTCEKCPEHCRNCLDSQTCTECMDFKYLAPSRQCVETCPTNTFHLGDGEAGRVCAYCEKGCHSCATSTRCLECNSSLHLDEVFNCVEVCPDGFYPEGDEDRGRSCLSCPTYCSICSGPDVCLECNVFRYLNPDSSCRPECPDGFYRLDSGFQTGGTCPRCFHTCNKCDSADVCSECKNFTYLTPDWKCNYECPAGYWESGTEEIGGTCERCSDNCMECTSAEVCEVCQNGYFLDISSSTCKKECPPGFWSKIPDPKVETGRTCELCSWPCNKCDSAKICTECKDSAYLTPFETCEYTCPPGYYPDGIGEINVTCQPCSENCATCDTLEVCTACKNEKYLNPDGSCQDFCPDGYWELPAAGGVGNACPLCAENCSLCTSATVCQECRNSTYLTHYDWCEATCQDGWYHEGIEDIGRHCKVCDPTCNKCEAEDYCTECKSSLYLTSRHLCEMTCPKGFYANRTRAVGGECEACPEQCTQCSSASTCSECRNGLYLTPDGFCEEICPTGHYAKVGDPFGVGGTCPMCPENCHACNNPEECTVCRHFTHLTAYGQCRSECPAGYYENGTANIGGNCNRCPSPCNLCETASVCTECAEASYLTHTGTCSYKCPDGYHYEGTEDIGRFCKICPPTCVTCLGQGQCSLCQNYTYLTPDETCEYTCPDGHYRQGIAETGNTCPSCPGDMERCINTTYATECKNKRYLTPAAKCEEGCPDGFYRLGTGEVGRSCPRCSTNCTLCSNATTCHECQNGQYLTHTNWCDHECPDGYYKFGEGDVGRICKACKAPCNTCLGPDWCTECKQGMFLTPKGTCELSCPDGYWASVGANGVGGTCAICPENCEECKTETTCTVCTNNTYLHANECKDRCPDGEDISNRECISCKPGCSQCSNQTWCSECKDGLFLTANGQCESTCPDGFFNLPGTDGIGGVCQLCAENCTKCEWWDRCLECKAFKYLTHYNWCTKACPAGYFEDGEGEVGRVCVACPDNCNTCENSLHCTECKNNSYLTPMKQCEGECPNGFFHEGFREVGRTCQACSANCNQCLSATECLECKGNAYLTEEQDCAASCPKGYYGQGEHIIGNTCQKCSKDCEECDGLELCTTCANSTFLTDSKYCAGECTTGFIQTGDTASGRVCEELCFWCNGG